MQLGSLGKLWHMVHVFFFDTSYPLLTWLLLQARANDFDVVLIDTAGRMQDNEVSRRF